MAQITPFHGEMYDPSRIRGIEKVVAPPYDMISPDEQETLYARDPHNCVRLILGRQSPADGAEDNRYTRAAADLATWRREGILRRDERPAIYLYEQEYQLPRRPPQLRRGFISRIGLEELGTGRIVPHEKTMSGPKQDRLHLMMACRANFSQVFAFYDDPARKVERLLEGGLSVEPRWDFATPDGIRHRLGAIVNREAVADIARHLRDSTLTIADGHHRYETALTFRRMMREQRGDDLPPGYSSVMMFCTNMASPGLSILPFHRLVSLPEGETPRQVLGRLASLGKLETLGPVGENREAMAALLRIMEERGEEEHVFGVHLPGEFHLLILRHRDRGVTAPDRQVQNLDVSLLHETILPRVLPGGPTEIAYLAREEDILSQVGQGSRQMAFLLNPTGLSQVRDIAAAGLRMPPKSTNFHPKVISGLVFNNLEE
jgi:uncharacterized protein (DUF1015 family)